MSSTAGSGSECSPPASPLIEARSPLAVELPVGSGTATAQIWLNFPGDKPAKGTINRLSVGEELSGTTILLTGVTGYVGSLLLELILRVAPKFRKVFLLIRNKKGVRAEERLKELLSGPIFQAHNVDLALAKFEVLNADMTEPSCGLSETECDRVCREVNYVIHSAAAIRFDMHIQDILKQTYEPTKNLLEMMAQAPDLRCFTFISTAFVNANLPKGTCVQEKIYPLISNSDVEEQALGSRLLQLPPDVAHAEANELMSLNGLQNTYFLAKNLTERMVAVGRPHRICILRPSIIGAVARAPCPGFIGNSSGFTAAILGAAAGIVSFVQHSPHSVVTLVPGDMVAATTLLATAAHGRAAALQLPAPCSTVVHACTSDTYPVNNHKLHCMCTTFLNEDPPASSTLTKEFRVEWVEHPLNFWWRCLQHSILVFCTACMLRWQGHHRLASRLNLAWERWRELASKRFDFNLTYQTTAAQSLERMIISEESAALKVTWHEAAGDSWLRYLRTYVAGTKHLFRNEPPTVFDTQDYRPCK